MKRAAALLCCLSGLLVCAGMLQLLLAVLPGGESGYAEAAVRPAGTVLKEIGGKITAAQNEVERALRIERREFDEFLKAGHIVCDGTALAFEQFQDLVEESRDFANNVTHIDQRDTLPSGCELVALAVAMRSEGYDVQPSELADRFLVKGKDLRAEYRGSPATDGGGMPPCIVSAGNAWLADRGEQARVHDLSGSSIEGLRRLVGLGYPVVTWVTEELADPQPSGPAVEGYQWYLPEHVVVLYGFEGSEVLVSDSLKGLVRLDASRFASVYEACGRRALFVSPS